MPAASQIGDCSEAVTPKREATDYLGQRRTDVNSRDFEVSIDQVR
jgi:hypothetical protein